MTDTDSAEPNQEELPCCEYCHEPHAHPVEYSEPDGTVLEVHYLCDQCDDDEIAAWESEY